MSVMFADLIMGARTRKLHVNNLKLYEKPMGTRHFPRLGEGSVGPFRERCPGKWEIMTNEKGVVVPFRAFTKFHKSTRTKKCIEKTVDHVSRCIHCRRHTDRGFESSPRKCDD